MASLTTIPRSPFWYICYRDPVSRQRRRAPTIYRVNSTNETRAARELRAKKTYEEKQAPRVLAKERWDVWVRAFFDRRYSERQQTHERFLGGWKTIEAYLLERGIETPAQVNHQVVVDYMSWRRASRKKPIAWGTVLVDIKIWRAVMEEALRHGWATSNPCLRLGISRKPVKPTTPIADAEDEIIREALREAPEWMQISYTIAMAQGCRFSETRVRLSDISLERMTIRFHAKGNNIFETSLTPSLVPLIRTLRERGATWTWDLSPNEMLQTGRRWTRFFRKLGLRHLHFHCTRSTAITRAHRGRVSLAKALRFFGHKSLVHWLYSQLGTEDTSEVASVLGAYPISSSGISAVASSDDVLHNPSSENPDAPSTRPRRPRPLCGPRKRKQKDRSGNAASRSRNRAARPSRLPA